MENVLVITCDLDIPQAVASAATLDSYKTWTFDPALVDELIKSGLSNVEYIDWESCTAFPELHTSSRALALAIEKDLYETTIKSCLPEVSNFAWLHLNLYYLLMANRWYTGLGVALSERFENTKPTIFINNNPACFFWPSFVPAVALLEALNAKNIAFNAFTYTERVDESDVVPMLLRTGDEPAACDLLTHLPTCLHDSRYFDDEITASGKTVVNLHAKYWDVAVTTPNDLILTRAEPLSVALPEDIRNAIQDCFTLLLDKLDAILSPYIRTESFRSRQAVQLATLYKSQLITYHLLNRYFTQGKPRKILLSDHDAGFHGPLISFAETHNIPVLFIPHSKTIADIQFDANTVTCLTHPIQGENMSDANDKRVLNVKLAYPEQLTGSSVFPARIKKIGLLLNAISLNGVLVTSYIPYIDGIRKIARWCKEHDVELSVRGRPGYSMLHALTGEAGIEASAMTEAMTMPLVEFAESLDLCLMYDAPTTAAIEFLKRSIPILNPLPEEIAKYEAVLANPRVVPRGSVDAIIRMMDAFMADSVNFHSFRTAQFAEYVNLFKNAQALRSHL